VHPAYLRAAAKKVPKISEEQIRDLRAKIGELAVANGFLSSKLKPWNGK